jgi:hypothetical protein
MNSVPAYPLTFALYSIRVYTEISIDGYSTYLGTLVNALKNRIETSKEPRQGQLLLLSLTL